MKKILGFVSGLIGILAAASLVKYGVDTYKENHKSRGTKLIDSITPKHRK